MDLIADRDDDEDGETLEKDNGDTPLVVYCLPNMTDMAMNLCIFFNNAIDFFLKEFGSYPFSSYAMVFVANNPTPTHNFAGVSMVSDTLLYSPNLIEPIISSTEILLDCISLQWSGINVVPQTYNDIWCTIGISTFMSYQFIRKLMGVNEYRFKMKSKMSEITDLDIGGKSPLALQFFRFPISTNDLDFIKLKSPLVLYILDKRMTKTDKSFGLTRVLPKVFLQAMSGDLPNGTLSTQHFQYVCEKVNRNKLDSFFKQWVYGAGVPIFRISQKFNKKRSIIEMSIRQVQQQETKHLHPKPETFINDSIAFLEDEPSFMIRPVFSGPMTIRIHEADGVPYEHIVEIKEGNMRLDIQYNSKFRRKKREEQQDEVDGVNGATSSMVAVPAVGVISDFSKLGDVLTKPREVEEWGLAEWSKRDEEDFNNDAFEWIRVDADFEWIAKIEVQQPDYMYGTQLQHDRDVEAQYESIRYFGDREKSNVTYCTALTRTIMDPRYYYGIRISAAKALGQLSNERNSFIGVKYLLKIFKELYCFKGSSIPLSNNFNDFNSFFLQRAIPEILSNIRDDDGNVPFVIKNLLLNLVKFNDNTDNEFTDCFYISDLMTALTTSALSIQLQTEESSNEDSNRNGSTNKDGKFLEEVITEVKRLQKLDEWIPLYQSIVSLTALKQKIRLATYGKLKLLFEDLLYYTLAKYPEDVRIEAFRGLFVLGGLKNKSILQYYLKCCLLDPKTSPYLRKRLVEILLESICIAAIKGTPSTLDDPEFKPYASMLRESDSATSVVGGDSGVGGTAIVVEDGASKSSEINTRRDAFARATLQGAIELLRRDYSIGEGLKEILWELLHSSLLSIYERRITFTLCEVLYQQWDSFPLTLSIPPLPLEELKKKFVVKVLGGGKIVIKREGRNMILFGKKEKKDAVPPVESKVDPVVVAPVAEPKLKLKLGGTSSKKPITITLGPPSKPKTLPKKEKKTATLPPPPPPAAPALREVPSTGTAAVVPSSSSPPLKLALKTTKPVPSMSVRTSTKSILTNKHIHVKNGKVTIKFSKEKFNKQNASVFDFPDPTPKPHTSLVKVKGTTVTFSLKSKQKKQEPSNFDMDNSRSLPNRYVKILLKSKKVSISSTPF